ncbi:CarD family transcriptional regulator [Novispirillum itersonii]|uniref:CarD family transcriptional regulator n=1 Tax=Novispirillum itersonii TaxID=189 RepID=UPI00035CB195|nr:CarD family transcriptional regulator [Novispirillum itersonii]
MSTLSFGPGEYVVYPAHGVGQIVDIEKQVIGGHELELIVITFDRERMTLRVPVAKAKTSGLRRLSTKKIMESALVTLKGRAKVRRAMWSRRAQEYEQKINSGDPVAIAEVVRDLYRSSTQPEQSYSERQIYEQALERLSCELAAVEQIETDAATAKLEKLLRAA